MLKWRLLTAALLIPAFVWSVLALPGGTLEWVFAGVLAGAAWEWTRFIPFRTLPVRLVFVIAVSGLLVLIRPLAQEVSLFPVWTGLVVCCWAFAALWLAMPEAGARSNPVSRLLKIVAAILVLLPTWLALVAIHRIDPGGPVLLLGLMVLIWSADSGAYFAGRKWGRHKLAPQVSPGKTWEGVLGGLLCSSIVALAGGWYFDLRAESLGWFVVVAIVTAGFSVIGDLFESLMKRQQGLKDSGQILPGHGGIMDRIDSLTAAGPVYLAGLSLTGLVGG